MAHNIGGIIGKRLDPADFIPPLVRISEHLWLTYDPNGSEVLMDREEYDRIQARHRKNKQSVMNYIHQHTA
jgi:hypothetical protein